MSKKTCAVIYNPKATKFSKNKLSKICLELSKTYSVWEMESTAPGKTIDLTKEANNNSDLIVSCGGDGTFGEVIKGMLEVEQKAIISHNSMGTANDVRNMLGLTKNPVKNAKLIANGVDKNLDIFTLNGEPFSYVAAFGYLANVPCNTSSELKKRLKYLAYLIQAVKEYKNENPIEYDMCFIDGDGGMHTESAIIATFTNSLGFGGMPLFKDVSLDDGMFEVTFIKNLKKLDMLKVVADIGMGLLRKDVDLQKYPNLITHFKTSSLDLRFLGENVLNNPLDVDGDPRYCFDGLSKDKAKIRNIKIERAGQVKIRVPNSPRA
ncbi:MAG: hypothetical protein IJO33_01455 [Bacilli bacterium]|nr:hypothetical protein [Bacilli bacterium]